MSEQISPTKAAVSAQALTLVSRELRSRQEAADRTQSTVRPVARAATQTQSSKASNLVIPSEALNPPPPRTELIVRANDLQQQAKQLDGLVSDEGVSALQRTVLMSRAKDLKRQVNELDGIVTSQFQQDQNQDRVLNRQPQVEPAALFTSSLFRSSSAQQQPSAGALRAFARNSVRSTATANTSAAQPAQFAASQVDLIA